MECFHNLYLKMEFDIPSHELYKRIVCDGLFPDKWNIIMKKTKWYLLFCKFTIIILNRKYFNTYIKVCASPWYSRIVTPRNDTNSYIFSQKTRVSNVVALKTERCVCVVMPLDELNAISRVSTYFNHSSISIKYIIGV